MSRRPRRARPGLPWVAWRLGRALAAEVASAGADWLPRPLARPLRRLALQLERHCESAALADALDRLASANSEASRGDAFEAFERLLRQIENPWNTSASDLHLARLPGRLRRALGGRLVWGRAVAGPEGWALLEQTHAATQRQGFRTLARGHFEHALADAAWAHARRALDAWSSLDGHTDRVQEPPSLQRARGELAWREGNPDTALDLVSPLLESGRCPSPFDVLDWGLRALENDRVDLAQCCFERAKAWLPEALRTWRLGAALARREGRHDDEARFLDRVLARAPQDLDSVLRRLALDLGEGVLEPLETALALEAPSRLEVGESGELRIRVEGFDPALHRLLVLPPAGWGIAVSPGEEASAGSQRANDAKTAEHRFRIIAHRGDRVRGGPWPLKVLLATPEGHCLAETTIVVPDTSPGRALLLATEDHEIHEERGTLDPALLERLLVDKSRLVADQAASVGVPWTHFVEAGSTLAMTDWAAESEEAVEEETPSQETWRRLRAAIRGHLAQEVARGHDLQPHLHTFNDPAYGHFPFEPPIDPDKPLGWRPSLRFLLTGAEARGDWASVTPPPGEGSADRARNRTPVPTPTFDRLTSAERAVARVESVGRLGGTDPVPVLWRSGLLEYGDTRDERAWSAVALRRAGLLAASDLAKPTGPGPTAVPPAFPCGWAKPFDPVRGGPLFQLPIVANTEGDYRMDSGRLAQRAKASLAAVADRPGVHCFTLLTHDKFINARFGADEFQDDPESGEWPLIRRHLEAWKTAGAEPVTADAAVRALVDDQGWHPEPRLVGETFWLADREAETVRVEYRVDVLGPSPPVDPDRGFPWRIPVPCSLRPWVATIDVILDGEPLAIEVEDRAGASGPDPGFEAFWVEMPRFPGGDKNRGDQDGDGHDRDTGLRVRFALRSEAPGAAREPWLETVRPISPKREPGNGGWELVLGASEPFLSARVLLPWAESAEPGPTADSAWIPDSPEVASESTDEGLLLDGLRFEADPLGRPKPLRLVLGSDTKSDRPQRPRQLEETPA